MLAKEKVTLTLPRGLMETVRQLAPPRGQSKFVAEAVAYYIEEQRRQTLREELIEGYKAMADESLALAQEWESVGNEAWLKHTPPYAGDEPENDAPNS